MNGLPQDKYVKVGEINTRYWQLGDAGPALILIHGLGGSVENWARNIVPLSAACRVYAVDLPGFGRSDKTPLIDSLYDLVTFIAGFMEVMGIDRASLAGNSLGGGLALKFAVEYPERLDKLVLVSTAGIGREVILDFKLVSLPFIGELLLRPSRNKTASIWKKVIYNTSALTPDIIDTAYELATLPGAREALLAATRSGISIRGQRSDLTRPLLEKLDTVTAPALITWGRQDRILPLAHAYKCRDLLPNAELHVFEECGHMVQLEYPDRFNELVLEFLAG